MSEKTGQQRAMAGCGCLSLIILILVVFSWARYRRSNSPTETVTAPSPIGIQYVKLNAVCATDLDAKPLIRQAYVTQDNDALVGLVQRDKAILLMKGTRFDASVPDGDGFVFGFVRSGRQIGRDCSIMLAFLQDQPAR
jgi:hypothetical protein